MKFLYPFIRYISNVNHKRLCWRKARKLSKEEQKWKKISPASHRAPNNIKKVLIICTHSGWGDSLFLTGFLHTLSLNGLSIDLATKKELVHRFQRLSYLDLVFDFFGECDTKIQNAYDCVVDLNYIAQSQYNFKLTSNLNAWKITCSDVYQLLETFDEYFDFSLYSHIANRYSALASRLLNKEVHIHPEITLFENDISEANTYLQTIQYPSKSFIYVNTVGRDIDRRFSKEQILSVLKTIQTYSHCNIVLYSPEVSFEEILENCPTLKSRLFQTPKVDFFTLATIVKEAYAIISPDTSIVHLGSVFSIPTLAVFCHDDIDYFGKYLVSELWGPLSSKSRIIDYSNKEKIFHKTIPISDITADLGKETLEFLTNLSQQSNQYQ